MEQVTVKLQMEDEQIKQIVSPKSDLFYVVANPFSTDVAVTLYSLDHCVKQQLVSNILCIVFVLFDSNCLLCASCSCRNEELAINCTKIKNNSIDMIYCRQAALRRATKLLMPTPQGRRPLPIPSGREGLIYDIIWGCKIP